MIHPVCFYPHVIPVVLTVIICSTIPRGSVIWYRNYGLKTRPSAKSLSSVIKNKVQWERKRAKISRIS